ncbi:MAG TPA: M20/M25/M40 family metallo-hydrolase [Gaiellaceae bacterium]|nr:M20/M25/M40 family metallo-hydrolase [Gaiellaceae bacterium]
MSIPATLEQLLSAPGPSGQESRAAEAWRDAARSFGEVLSDVLGSSRVLVPGTGGGPLLAIVGHIDEIALVVTHAGDDGLLAVRPIGGFDPNVLLGQRLEILTKDGMLPAVVGARKQKRRRGEERKAAEFDDLFLDVGARNGEEARTLVRVGDAALVAGGPLELRNGRVAARALDNRLGCYVALEAARRIAAEGGAPGDVVGLAVVQEEVGDFAGARTSAYDLRPAVAIAVDVTHATDVRGGDPEDEGDHRLGTGAAIMRGPSIHPQIFELLHEAAEAEGIPFSIEISRGHTNTDADAVYLSRVGVATGLVSIPLRYMHTPVEVVDLADVEAVVRLLVAFARRLEPGQTFMR